MDRLTYRHEDQRGNPTNRISPEIHLAYQPRDKWIGKVAIRLAAIEDILGDDYDLDRLRELVEADRDGRCHIGRFVECAHYEGLAVCEFLGDCGGTDWICGWFEPKKAAEAALEGETQ